MNRDSWRLGTDMNDYRSLVLSLSPVAYWRLGEKSGTVARDEMGLHHGAYVGSPTLGVPGLLEGDPDTAVALTAAGQVVTLPDATKPTGPFSYGAWVTEASGGAAVALILGANNTGPGQCWIFSYRAGGYLSFIAGSVQIYGGIIPANGTTYFAVGTWDGTYSRLYQNAALVAGPTVCAPHGVLTTPMLIGDRLLGGAGYDIRGSIDEVAIWSRALTAANVAALYQTGRKYR